MPVSVYLDYGIPLGIINEGMPVVGGGGGGGGGWWCAGVPGDGVTGVIEVMNTCKIYTVTGHKITYTLFFE